MLTSLILDTGKGKMMDRRHRGIIFYRLILPGFTLVNLGLGIFTLTGLKPNGPMGWMMLGTGAFCCGIAGRLAGAGWSKRYWGSAMERQGGAGGRLADAIFRWVEEDAGPAGSLRAVQLSLHQA